MDAAILATLSRLLDEALERGPDEQRAWLDSLGPEYDTVRPRLQRLLWARASVGATDFLGTLPKIDGSDTTGTGSAGDSDPREGSTFGPYSLVRELATGGMGSVWLAERIDGMVKRPVALKLPRGAWRQRGLAERMAREREILAGLNHPHIARLYDAGIAPDGQPYLALEYVDGRPIDQYCREAQLGVPARLRLFLQVVSAVAHAHSRLVVHRDLKPSNILVTSDGQVRLLDFGIAKLLEGSDAHDSAITHASGRALTPDYASPEQITGASIGTASDVYSLGVVLYELLTGTKPYRLKRDSRGALEDAILEAEPVRPSQIVADRSLGKALRGDLDWITGKAMAKEPDQRYLSVAALGADIERHLRQEPVEAAAPGATYRLAKFVRRHRRGLAASVVVALALIGGIVGTTIGLVRARTAEADARASGDSARIEAATAARVTRFLLELFDVTKPEEADGREVTAREMLDRGASRIRAELAQEPLVQARMLRSLGDAYSSLGLYPQARPMLEDAVAVARRLGDTGGQETAQALLALGQLRRRLDDAQGAESAVREALAIGERVHGANSLELGPIVNDLALLLRTKDPDEAVRLYRRTYDMLVAAHGPNHGDAGVVLQNIGAIQTRTRRYKEAHESLTQALAVVNAEYGENDPRVAAIVGNLALVERELGNYRRAVEFNLRDLELSTRALGADHPTIGTIWLNLARSTQRTGDYPAALAQVEKALAILRRHFSPQHALILTSENSRALYLVRLGRADEARALLGHVLELRPESNEGTLALLAGRLQLAEIERIADRSGQALALAQGVLDDPVAARNPKLFAEAHWARACVLAAQQAGEAADRARRNALQVQESDPQATASGRLYAQAQYAACARDGAGALQFLQEAVANGFSDPAVLVDPTFAAVRALPAFAKIARAVTPNSSMDAELTTRASAAARR